MIMIFNDFPLREKVRVRNAQYREQILEILKLGVKKELIDRMFIFYETEVSKDLLDLSYPEDLSGCVMALNPNDKADLQIINTEEFQLIKDLGLTLQSNKEPYLIGIMDLGEIENFSPENYIENKEIKRGA